MPPPSAVLKASTSTPNASSSAAAAAMPPSSANTNTPPRSSPRSKAAQGAALASPAMRSFSAPAERETLQPLQRLLEAAHLIALLAQEALDLGHRGDRAVGERILAAHVRAERDQVAL